MEFVDTNFPHIMVVVIKNFECPLDSAKFYEMANNIDRKIL